MTNTVTMNLRDYDRMKDEIDYLRKQIKEMEKDRIKELKEIFKLRESINDIDIKIDYGNIIKKLYGEEIKIEDKVYKIDDDKYLTEIVYNIWKLVKEEE